MPLNGRQAPFKVEHLLGYTNQTIDDSDLADRRAILKGHQLV